MRVPSSASPHRLVACVAGFVVLLAPAPARAISRDEVMARAWAWVEDAPLYSQTPWYTDPTSGTCCYRSDCSGFVSAVWDLPPPGHTTYSFAGGPWDDGVSYVIDGSELRPGDALNAPGDPAAGTGHVMLYVSGDYYSGYVEVIEEYSWGVPVTHHWVWIDPADYLPIRYVGIEDCTPEVCDLADNDCDGQVNEDEVCEVAIEPAVSAHRYDPAASTDVDGDGAADLCGRDSAGLHCTLSGSGGGLAPVLAYFNDANGFGDFANATTIRLADVDGDGRADACGRHDTEGFVCFRSEGAGFGTRIPGPALTDANGWGDVSNYATLRMGDVDGDGRADLCGRGDVTFDCWLSDGASLSQPTVSAALPDAYGWNNAVYYSTIRLADVDADARLDLCVRAPDGVHCWLYDGVGFSAHVQGPGLVDAYGWGLAPYNFTLEMPDVNGDGAADVCARAPDALYCWPSTGHGFGDALVGPPLADAAGWSSHASYATIAWADLDGDGREDVCGRGRDGVACWRSTGSGFSDALTGPPLSDANGWSDHANYTTLQWADLDADGRADVCARGDAGMACWTSDGAGFPVQGAGPAWSDADGWADIAAYGTIRFAGGRGVRGDSDDTGGVGGDTAGDDSVADAAGDDSGGMDLPGEAGTPGACGCDAGAVPGAVGAFGIAGLAAVARRRGRERRHVDA